jgi:hypothetical protein
LQPNVIAEAHRLAIDVGQDADVETVKLVNRQRDLFLHAKKIAEIVFDIDPDPSDPTGDSIPLESRLNLLARHSDEARKELSINRLKDELRRNAQAGDPPRMKDQDNDDLGGEG